MAKGQKEEAEQAKAPVSYTHLNAAQYATAAVLMLRYCGIPARYVEGYLPVSYTHLLCCVGRAGEESEAGESLLYFHPRTYPEEVGTLIV